MKKSFTQMMLIATMMLATTNSFGAVNNGHFQTNKSATTVKTEAIHKADKAPAAVKKTDKCACMDKAGKKQTNACPQCKKQAKKNQSACKACKKNNGKKGANLCAKCKKHNNGIPGKKTYTCKMQKPGTKR